MTCIYWIHKNFNRKKISINKINKNILSIELKVEILFKENNIKIDLFQKKNNNNLYLINQSLNTKISDLN